jgi:hypothetical protein
MRPGTQYRVGCEDVGEQVSRNGPSAAHCGRVAPPPIAMVACSPAAHGLWDKGAAYCHQRRLTAKDGRVMTDSDPSTDVEFKRAQLAFEREKWQAEESWAKTAEDGRGLAYTPSALREHALLAQRIALAL